MEAVLAKHPAVGACVVVARRHARGETACSVCGDGWSSEAEPRELREICSRSGCRVTRSLRRSCSWRRYR
ncbi:MAG: hypothetical protein H6951_19375 [Zoogloeaceae bacterium]|nr:hypothetical protein [Zoogloeaceae bacterium]